ncbi:MAG: 50S ribosomal protein L35ae [Candidatus Bathyarchaeia archaeon]
MSQSLKGFVVSYVRGPKTQNSRECILRFPNIKCFGEASRLVGRKVAWPATKHTIRGKIIAPHGKTGLVKARFKKGLPGQAIGTHVEIIG